MTDMSPDLSLAERIDSICDRFEQDFRAGQQPRIEQHLSQSPEPLRPALLKALVGLEVELRQKRGETPQVDEYVARFPDQLEAVRQAFTDSRSMLSSVKVAAAETSLAPGAASSPPASSRQPLQMLGRFEVLSVLGEGAFGTVYKAHDPQLDRDVAIKVPRAGSMLNDDDRERFLREARAAAGLHHALICPVHEVGTVDSRDYIVMAYIEGKPLSKVMQTQSRPSDKQIVATIRKIALALQEAHEKGIIHRDLKPANVMINRKGEPVIMDFGLARRTNSSDAQISQSGQIMGTPAYMSPEQARGDGKAVGPAADVYSLGVMFYELLCGRRPFEGTITEVIGRILHVAADPPSKHRPDLDSRLEALCLKAIAKEPAKRFASMKEFAAALADFAREPDKPAPVETKSPVQTVTTSAGTTDKQRHIQQFIQQGQLPAALEALKPLATNPDAQLATWAKEQTSKVQGEIKKWREQLPTLTALGHKLIRKCDYAEAKNILSQIPSGLRPEEIQEALQEAEDKQEECDLLQVEIDEALRKERPKELPSLVKRFLQLKPGHKAMQKLADELKQYGPERAIRIRKGQKSYDVVGSIWDWKILSGIAGGLAVLFAGVYFAVILFITRDGTVMIDVHSPGVVVQFANDEITVESSGKTYRLKPSDSRTLKVLVDGLEIDTGNKEISVSKNDKKEISAKLLTDEKLELVINGKTQTFAVPGKAPINAIASKESKDERNEWALEFSGDDAVILPIPTVPETCTVEAWFTPQHRMDDYQFPVRADFASPRTIFLNANTPDRRLKVSFGGIAGDRWTDQSFSKPEPKLENRLVHVAGVWTNGMPSLFVDGRKVGQSSSHDNNGSDARATSQRWYLGAQSAEDNGQVLRGYKGTIQAVRISSNVRYTNDFMPQTNWETDPQTVALYRFHDGPGDMLTDSSENKFHGKILGARWARRADSAPSPAGGDLARWQGRWRCVSENSWGKVVYVNDNSGSGPVQVIQGELRTLDKVSKNNKSGVGTSRFRINETASPKTFDCDEFLFGEEKFRQSGIYEFAGPRLRVVYRFAKQGQPPRATWDDIGKSDVHYYEFERATDDGWVQLFNGKDLSGWTMPPNSPPNPWKVENGLLIAEPGPPMSMLITDRGDYRDVHLRAEAKFGGGRAGFKVRTALNLDLHAALSYTIAMYDKSPPPEKGRITAFKPPLDTWVTLELIIRGFHVKVLVDGKVLDEYDDAERLRPSGYIGLARGPGTNVAYRKIEVKELTPATTAGAPADAVTFNGHAYKFFPEKLSWTDAKRKCEQLGGHLPVVNDQAENDFLVKLCAGKFSNSDKIGGPTIWLGATDVENEGDWKLIDGKPLAYKNWYKSGNQPNNGGGKGEHYATLLLADLAKIGEKAGGWSDQPDASTQQDVYFVCEWDGNGASAAAETGWLDLFNGTDLSNWVRVDGQPPAWKVESGYMEVVPGSNSIITRESFPLDYELHVEFWLPDERPKPGQRSNSGIYLHGRHEIQICDNFENPLPDPKNACGALYGEIAPRLNACTPAETWQTYDITYRSPRVNGQKQVTTPGRLTVIHNGQKIIDDAEFRKISTQGQQNDNIGQLGPIMLQDRGSRVRFRNIRLRPLAAAPPAAANGWLDLFNGKDLTGWKAVGTPTWSWSDGRLVGEPPPGNRAVGVLMTEADYDNFELQLEFRANQGFGSGLFLRTDPNSEISGKGCLEVQMADDEEFKTVPATATGSVYNVFPRKVDPQIRRNDWNTLRVRLNERQIEVWVNDVQTVDADLDSVREKFAAVPGLARKTGSIALQQNQKADVEFRNVRIRPLDAATDDVSWINLFNGQDLTGWNAVGTPGGWSVNNGEILVDGGTQPESKDRSGWLLTEREFKDYVLELEFAAGVYANSGIGFRCQGTGYEQAEISLVNNSDPQYANTTAHRTTGALHGIHIERVAPKIETNQWNRMRVEQAGRRIKVTVNDVVTLDANLDDYRDNPAFQRRPGMGAASGPIGLQKWTGTVRFRNIRIKPLTSGSNATIPADAQSFNDHAYKFFAEKLTWKEAKARCEAVGGHLIVVDNAEENAYAAKLVADAKWEDAWIGATDEAKEGDWRTVKGNPLPFTNWGDKQPNNKPPGEHWALMSNKQTPQGRIGWKWSDQPNDSSQHKPGYLCEWDSAVK